jgi:hypothetical protein
MNFNYKGLPIDQAKEIDMISYLAALGFEPTKIVRDDYWYLSPFRNERTASFKINAKLNRWYDHGIGKGGSLIDFGILFFNCSLGEFLRDHCGTISLLHAIIPSQNEVVPRQSKLIILKEKTLGAPPLLQYLEQRKIPMEIASVYCREVRFSVNNRFYNGIGFKNDLGGFEIRSPHLKLSSFPKGITTFGQHSGEVLVFEGFFDFLSFKTLHHNSPKKEQDYVVLNSLAMLEKARPFMEQHQKIRLFLDRDQAGEKCTHTALSWSDQYKDESALYQGQKDLNQWLMTAEKANCKKLKPKLRP